MFVWQRWYAGDWSLYVGGNNQLMGGGRWAYNSVWYIGGRGLGGAHDEEVLLIQS